MSQTNSLSCGIELFFDSEVAVGISAVGEKEEEVRIDVDSRKADQQLSLVLRRAEFEKLVTSGQRFLLVESPKESEE